ncbi:ribosomal protein S18-alanine N-acetyltransferase [Agaribacterium haliotis]|uniref:ribosomal protein S18-alanine N-acetyltransferase n=1 Tax=Agaribacterium haliotis TaxID=2013869 RepID=UPI000BB58ED2|nr:ribosomal protein S18-alanine N-acetyltransferase [Agaribacterium haliotis]
MRAELCHWQSEDVDALARLESAASPHGWSRQALEQASLAPKRLRLAMVSEGHWLAHAVFSFVADEAELLIISVHPAHRGQGLAQALIRAAIDELGPTINSVFLELRASNDAAKALYNKLGFSLCGRRKNYYRSGVADGRREDALLMRLDLKQARANTERV